MPISREKQQAATLNRWKTGCLLTVLGLILFIFGAWMWWRHAFPYGRSHACSKQIALALRLYAEENGHWLAHGCETPEASLGLIAKELAGSTAHLLAGKHIRPEVVRRALDSGKRITAEICGWHYVEGLRDDDDPEIAVAWDKVEGLDHNGRWRRTLAREVVFLGGWTRLVSKDEWPAFVAAQKEKLAAVRAARNASRPNLRWSDEITLGPSPR